MKESLWSESAFFGVAALNQQYQQSWGGTTWTRHKRQSVLIFKPPQEIGSQPVMRNTQCLKQLKQPWACSLTWSRFISAPFSMTIAKCPRRPTKGTNRCRKHSPTPRSIGSKKDTYTQEVSFKNEHKNQDSSQTHFRILWVLLGWFPHSSSGGHILYGGKAELPARYERRTSVAKQMAGQLL